MRQTCFSQHIKDDQIIVFTIGLSVECHFSLDSPSNYNRWLDPLPVNGENVRGTSCCLESKLENWLQGIHRIEWIFHMKLWSMENVYYKWPLALIEHTKSLTNMDGFTINQIQYMLWELLIMVFFHNTWNTPKREHLRRCAINWARVPWYTYKLV